MSDSIIADEEAWHRVITRANYINTQTNKLADQFFKGALSESGHEQWSHEMSGCRSHLVPNVDAQGLEFIEALQTRNISQRGKRNDKLVYSGVAHATAKALRSFTYAAATSDVIFTPKGPAEEIPNNAHSDFIVISGEASMLNRIVTFLQDQLQISRPAPKHPFMLVTASQTTTIISNIDPSS